MIERKEEEAEKVVGTGEGWLTELSTADLKGTFALWKGLLRDRISTRRACFARQVDRNGSV